MNEAMESLAQVRERASSFFEGTAARLIGSWSSWLASVQNLWCCLPGLVRLVGPCLLALCAGSFGCVSAQGANLLVFAAASLTESLKEIGTSYHTQTGDTVRFNFASSSFLARQIEEGAQADVFFSADEAKMNVLEKQGLVVAGTRVSLLSNSLVIVVGSDTSLVIESVNDLRKPRFQRIALADPRTVPAGIYAREYLERAGLWSAVQRKIVPLDNVRAALSAVESGDVEAGIVYQTDATISKKVRIAYRVPKQNAPAISYPVAVLRSSTQLPAAKQFVRYLQSAESRRVFQRFGFIVLE